MSQDQGLPDIKLDRADLYREETFTDRRAGTLRRLTPVTADGADDSSRSTVFEGHASLMTPGGALPLQFEVEAENLDEALDKYPAAARAALEHTLQELQRMQREQQSSIVVPGQGGPGGPGGMPAPGKIQF